MRTRRQVWLIVIAALLGFACAPSLSLAPAPTLDPLSMNTAIALTADAASAQTAAVAQGSQPTAMLPILDGPTLDPLALNTAIAETAAAAAAQTQALVPNTLTPSVTPLPSKTPTITPTPTLTFIFTIPPTATKPGAIPTSKGGGGGGNNGGGDNGGGDITLPYTCKATRVTPKNESTMFVDTQFDIVWLVKNTGSNWHKKNARLVYKESTLISLVKDKDLPPLSIYDISGGDIVATPPVTMKTPSKPGIYWTSWWVYVEGFPACNLQLTIIVKDPNYQVPERLSHE